MSAAGPADAAAALSPVGRRFRWNGKTHFGNDGLIWWLGTKGGTGGYENPGTDAELEPGDTRVKIESTGICCDSIRSFLRRRNGLGSTEDHGLDTHVTITLPTALVPTHYSIMHGMYEDEQVPRSWQLKGSNDGVRWTVLRDHVDDVSFGRGGYLKQTWALDTAVVVGSYTRFRIQMTGPNGHPRPQVRQAGPEPANEAEDDFQLVFSGLEFYGVCPVPVIVSRSSSSSKLGIAKLEVDDGMLTIAKLQAGSPAASVLKPGDRVVCVNNLAAPFAHADTLAAAVANNPNDSSNGRKVVIRKAATSEIKRHPSDDLRLWLLPADDGMPEPEPVADMTPVHGPSVHTSSQPAPADMTPLQPTRLGARARKLSTRKSHDSGTESLDSQHEYAQQTVLQPRHEDSSEETQESSLGIDTRTPLAVMPVIAAATPMLLITPVKVEPPSPHTATPATGRGAPPTAPESPATASPTAVASVAPGSAAKATAVQSRSPMTHPAPLNPSRGAKRPLATTRPDDSSVQTGCFQSSILLRYEYDAAAKILILVTKRGDAYRYRTVDAPVVQKLQDAPSIGTFWNKQLKKKYFESKVGTKSKPHTPLSHTPLSHTPRSGGDPSSMQTTASKRPRTAVDESSGTTPVRRTAIDAASNTAAGTKPVSRTAAKRATMPAPPHRPPSAAASPRAGSKSPARSPKATALPSQAVLASSPTSGSSANAATPDGAGPAVMTSLSGAESSLSGADLLAGRTFTFSGEDFDGEGVLYWLGTHGKSAGYQNPATCLQCRGGAAAALCALPHCARVTSTLISDGDSHLFVEHQFANQNWTVDEKTETFFAVELPAPISVTHYTLRHGDKEDLAYSLRNWVLEGSADGKIWTTLSSHDEDESLRGNYQSHTWKLPKRAPPCRHFRVMVARKNEAGTFHLVVCGFELYGTGPGVPLRMTHPEMDTGAEGAGTDAHDSSMYGSSVLNRASHPKATAARSDVKATRMTHPSSPTRPEPAEPASVNDVHDASVHDSAIETAGHRKSKRRRTAASPVTSPQPRSTAVRATVPVSALAPSPKVVPAVVKETERPAKPARSRGMSHVWMSHARPARSLPTDCGGGESIMFGESSNEVDDSAFQGPDDSAFQGPDDSAFQGPEDPAGGCTPVTLQGQLDQLFRQIDAHEQRFDRLDDTTNLDIEAAEADVVQCEAALARAQARVQAKKRARQQALFDHNAKGEALQAGRTALQQRATRFEDEVAQRELTTLSVAEVCELLHLLKCPVPISLLRDEGVGGKELKLLREGDMQSILGIERLGDRRRLSAAVKALAANMGFRRPGDGANGWSIDRVCDWLEDEELDRFTGLFREQAIDGAVLLALTPDDLRSHFHVRTIRETTQILEKINELNRETFSTVPSPEFNINAGLITPTPREKQVGPFGRGASAGDRRAAFDELIRTSDALRQFMVQVESDNPPFQRGPAADRQYNCPITGEVMQEPFVAGDGYTYEKVAIQAWLHRHKEAAIANGTPTAYSTSPKTGAAMTADLKPNMTLFDRMHSTSQSQMQF